MSMCIINYKAYFPIPNQSITLRGLHLFNLVVIHELVYHIISWVRLSNYKVLKTNKKCILNFIVYSILQLQNSVFVNSFTLLASFMLKLTWIVFSMLMTTAAKRQTRSGKDWNLWMLKQCYRSCTLCLQKLMDLGRSGVSFLSAQCSFGLTMSCMENVTVNVKIVSIINQHKWSVCKKTTTL